MLTHQDVVEILDYDKQSGVFVWKKRIGRRSIVGAEAGTITRNGYRYIQVNGERHMAHRLAWLAATGKWPEHEIDHINGNRLDNRISNLRQATHNQNQWNTKRRLDNRSGCKGVSLFAESGKWMAYLNVRKRRVYLGLFATKQEAIQARCEAERQYHGEFARGAA